VDAAVRGCSCAPRSPTPHPHPKREAIDDAEVVTAFAPVSAAPAEDSLTCPVIDQAELQWRSRYGVLCGMRENSSVQ